MKPKDLLQHLEKGDRTMHHLTKKPEAQMFGGGIISGSISTSDIARFANQLANQTVSSMWYGNQQAASTTTGGIVRW